jgi:hypothetical protein
MTNNGTCNTLTSFLDFLFFVQRKYLILELGCLSVSALHKFHIVFSKSILTKSLNLYRGRYLIIVVEQRMNSLNIIRRVDKNIMKDN